MKIGSITRRVLGTSNIRQEYDLYDAPAAASRAVSWKDATIIELWQEDEVEPLGYDAIPVGQPLPEMSKIVGHKVLGKFRRVRPDEESMSHNFRASPSPRRRRGY